MKKITLSSKAVADIIEGMELNNAIAYCNTCLDAPTTVSGNGVVEATYTTLRNVTC